MDFQVASDWAFENIDWNAAFGPRPTDIGRFWPISEALHSAPPPEGAHCVAHPKVVVLRAIELAGFSEEVPNIRGCDFPGQITQRFIKDFEPVLTGRTQRGSGVILSSVDRKARTCAYSRSRSCHSAGEFRNRHHYTRPFCATEQPRNAVAARPRP
jgi:hypothetical protein